MEHQNNNTQHFHNISHLNQRVNELAMSLKVYQEETIRRRDILETSRDYLQSVIDNIGDIVLVIGTDYRVVLANKKLKQSINNVDPVQKGLFCYKLSHLGETSCKDKDHPCPMKKVLKTKAPVSITRMHTDSNGSSKFIDIVAAPLFNHEGKIVHIIESCRDITDRVKTEQSLMDSEIHYRALFEQSSDAIFILEAEGPEQGKIVSANNAACHMHGYSQQELCTLSIADIITPAEVAMVPEQINKILNEKTLSPESIHRKNNGDLFPVEASASLITTSGRKLILAICRDISRRKKFEEERNRFISKLEFMSQTDGLTGLFNRQHLDKRLSEEIHRAQRYSHPLSLIMFDINNFKHINDTFGHIAGDKILQNTASIINVVLRDTDIAGRFGGDEFIIILTETSIDVGTQVAERLLRKIKQAKVPVKKNQKIGYTVSMGIAEYSGSFKTPEEFIAKADHALYSAKKSRSDRVSREHNS